MRIWSHFKRQHLFEKHLKNNYYYNARVWNFGIHFAKPFKTNCNCFVCDNCENQLRNSHNETEKIEWFRIAF